MGLLTKDLAPTPRRLCLATRGDPLRRRHRPTPLHPLTSPPPEEASGELHVATKDGGGEDLAASLLAKVLGRRGGASGGAAAPFLRRAASRVLSPRLLGREGGE